MRDIIKKMRYKMPGRFFGFNIFLSAYTTIPALYFCPAIQTSFVFSFFKMRHRPKF